MRRRELWVGLGLVGASFLPGWLLPQTEVRITAAAVVVTMLAQMLGWVGTVLVALAITAAWTGLPGRARSREGKPAVAWVVWVGSVVLIVVGALLGYGLLPYQLMIGETTVPVPWVVERVGADIGGGLMTCGFVLVALQVDRWLNGLGSGHDAQAQEGEVDKLDDEELAASR